MNAYNLGRGTLVVLDFVPESGAPTYEQRRAVLEPLLQSDPVFSGDTIQPVPSGVAVLTPNHRVASHADALAFYERLRTANRVLGCDFFGVSGAAHWLKGGTFAPQGCLYSGLHGYLRRPA